MPFSKIDIHDRKGRLKRLMERVDESDISEDNKKLLREYRTYNESENLSLSRIEKNIQTLFLIARMIDKPFNELKEEDVINTVARINTNEKWKDSTKRDFKVIFKKFYFKYIKKLDEYPPFAKKLVGRKPDSNHIIPETLLSIDDITRVASVSQTIRNKALVYVLYESGCRIGELLNVRVGNVHFDELGVLIDVNGKTGERRVRLVTSKEILRQHIGTLPSDPNQPLWLDNKNKPMNYCAVYRLFERLFEKANIEKKFNPHLFRHSRATHLAKLGFNEALLKKIFGWTDSSETPSVYIHLAQEDVDSALLGLHGIEIKKEGKKLEKAFRVIICPSCHRELTPDEKICPCGVIFDRKLTRERMIDHETVDAMLESDWFRNAFERRLKEMGYVKKS